MTKLQVFTSKGAKSGEQEFPKTMLVKGNAGLMAQVFRVFENRSHKGTSKVKTRAEVNLSTRKIYKQKGTGGARHGSKKAPIFVGGGVAHGPKGINRQLSISKKLNKTALKMFLAQKVEEKAVCFVGGLASIGKTKEAANLLNSIGKGLDRSLVKNIMIVLGNDKKDVFKFFRNIKGIKISYWRDLNSKDVFQSSFLVIDKDAFAGEEKKVKVPKKVTEKTIKGASATKKVTKKTVKKIKK
jgi:large subunit ribosomal protein L4